MAVTARGGFMALHAVDVRKVFESILTEEAIAPLVKNACFQRRERKLDTVKLVRAMIIAAATGYGGRPT